MPGKSLTPAHLARRLDLHVETIRRWIADGRFRAGTVTNMGTAENPRYRITREEVERIQREGLTPMRRSE